MRETGHAEAGHAMEQIEIRESKRGVRIKLRVKPSARKAAIEGVHGGALKVSVSEPPEKGKANDGVVRLLAEQLRVPVSVIEIVAGQSSRNKLAEIAGLDPESVRRLRPLCGKARHP